jgi:23S rRNA pseudouridine1911/1915/1917 synthase
MKKKIKIQIDVAQRLDTYLSGLFGMSRAKVQKIINAGEITVNKLPAKNNLRIKTGDAVMINEKSTSKTRVNKTVDMPQIIYEDDEVLVIDKPAGMKVHRVGENDKDITLAQVISKKYPQTKKVGDDPTLRPGIVHRLDKYASGVLIIAKTQKAFEMLKGQFKNRSVKKIYTVLVYGSMPKDHGTIQLRLERSKEGKIVAHPENADRGRDAVTEYDVVGRFATATLLHVQIHTGRTHQIRAHMFAIGHPVVGDEVYTQKKMKRIRKIEISRLFLHASELTIQMPDGKTQTFKVPLPKQLDELLNALHKI